MVMPMFGRKISLETADDVRVRLDAGDKGAIRLNRGEGQAHLDAISERSSALYVPFRQATHRIIMAWLIMKIKIDKNEDFRSEMLSLKGFVQEKRERKLCEDAYAEGVGSERRKWIDACNESEHDLNGMIDPVKLFDILGLKWE